MTAWTLALRNPVNQRVDAAPISLIRWRDQSIDDVKRTQLAVGGRNADLADLFSVKRDGCDDDRLVVEGDLRAFDRIACDHRRGVFRVTGSVGDFAGGLMSGGVLRVDGDAGSHLAAPHGAQRQGMRGGRIEIGGSVKDYAGHRMRRGELMIEGNAGRFAASQMIAGTIMVGGELGDDAATGMRRGTLIASRFPDLPRERFSVAAPIRSVFLRLFDLAPPDAGPSQLPRVVQMINEITSSGLASRRGDGAVAGQGEIVSKHDG